MNVQIEILRKYGGIGMISVRKITERLRNENGVDAFSLGGVTGSM